MHWRQFFNFFSPHYYRRMVIRECRRGLMRIKSSRALDKSTKRHLRKRIIYYEMKVSRMRILEEVFLRVGATVALPSLMVFQTLIALYFWDPYGDVRKTLKSLSLLEFSGAVAISLFSMLVIVFPLMTRLAKELASVLFLLASPGLVSLTFAGVFWGLSRPLVFQTLGYVPMVSAGLSAFVMTTATISMWLFVALSVFASHLMDRYKYSVMPEAVVVDRLIAILYAVELMPVSWWDLEFKHFVISNLEKCASVFQEQIPRRLHGGDPHTDAWVSETAERMASALRPLKRWVITPKMDTRDFLVARIAKFLAVMLYGNWDSIERSDLEPISRPRLWRTRVSEFLSRFRILLSGLAPLLALGLVERASLMPEGSTGAYLKVGAYVWVSITLLAVLDPGFGSRVSALKDIVQLLTPYGKDKK